MMILPEWKTQGFNLISTGHPSGNHDKINEDDAEIAIQLLLRSAEEDPALLLDSLVHAAQNNVMGMIATSISICLSKTDSKFLSENNTLSILYLILSHCNANELLIIVKNLKYKKFGKGLGSKQQKIIRKAMESW